METEERIRTFVETTFGRSNTPIGPDTSLLDSGLIDSTGILELVSFLESAFGIELADEDVVPEHFENVRAITAYVNSRQHS